MRIGIDIRNIGKKRTGDEVVFFNLVKNLSVIDSRNEYFLLTDIENEHDLAKLVIEPLEIKDKNNFRVISLRSSNKFFWNIWSLPHYLRKNPVDVYHTQYITPLFVPKETRIITTIHDISFNYYPQFIRPTDLFFLKMLIPLSLKRADKIIAVSDFTKKEIAKFYHLMDQKIVVVRNAVSHNFINLNVTNEKKKIVKNKYKLPEKFILYLGTLQPRKNLPFLIKAFTEIRKKLPDIWLVIAGGRDRNADPKIEEILRTSSINKRIIFTGYIDEDDKPVLYDLSLLFVFPSFYEGFGIPLLEAMSRQVPVLASDIPANRETAGEAALYFDANKVASLKDLLYNALIDENLRNNLKRSGLQRSRFFSWKKSAKQTLAVYESLTK